MQTRALSLHSEQVLDLPEVKEPLHISWNFFSQEVILREKASLFPSSLSMCLENLKAISLPEGQR